MRRAVLVGLVVAFGLSGCGGDDNGEGGSAVGNAEPDDGTYSCSDVWVVGETLPEDYDGSCADGDSIASSGLVDCADGSQYATYDDRYYAKLGGEILAGPNAEDGTTDDQLQAEYDKFANGCLG